MLKLRERHKGRRCFQTAMPADGLIAAHSVKWRRTARPTIAGSSSHTTRSHAPEKGLSRSYPERTRPGFPDPRQAADRYIWIAKACGLRSRSQSTNIFDRALCRLNSSIAPRPQRVKLRGTQWEHISSAWLPNPDMARCSRHVSKVPIPDPCMATNRVQFDSPRRGGRVIIHSGNPAFRRPSISSFDFDCRPEQSTQILL